MCGIVASVSSQGRVYPDALLRATQRLRHRGPDAQRVWVPTHARVGLGHARLSIIDLATGDQPIANEDGSLHIVANGEFYDFEAIRQRLEQAGHRFRTRSDSEIALHLYEDGGARCLHQLRGEFAFAIWDERDGGWFSTTGEDESVLLRLKEDYDGAEPAASSVSVMNLLALAHLGLELLGILLGPLADQPVRSPDPAVGSHLLADTLVVGHQTFIGRIDKSHPRALATNPLAAKFARLFRRGSDIG